MVLSMDRWVGKVAIVTGASSGIGAAIAEQLVEHGLQVVGLARRKERIEQLAEKLIGEKGKLFAIKTDISKEEDILNAFKWVKENLGPVHILVNNAGIGVPKNLTDGDTEDWKKLFQVNVMGPCIATREAVRDMRANNVDGHIIHINSIAGNQILNIPNLNVYSASKFALRALAETLRLELNNLKLKIKITNLSPGAVNTEIIPQEMRESEVFKKLIEEKQFMEGADIADSVIYVLSTPPHVQVKFLNICILINLIFITKNVAFYKNF
ncbi:hypothetical protein NQ314_014561 [Rhamnusium bicolor]|uniref:Farnesol dehydrogenase-like n=1 Tax=Rhamnusium bicolor TaxID=1586634 RepID=A0AAV8X2B7_9CUCU|nr:hypothetical protein NQ314_014561 [Rhamnusium bicolor]